ncbi:sialidase family protein [uncultured Paludibaculum sp.]|uniref:sialidase family protein n=1 Tax=uncultured Paludibaculum sp. TaxID=1765020 RepID=UPI002AAAF7E6|nr:sialidase family protein [uncultured Paludibaculum sp.]
MLLLALMMIVNPDGPAASAGPMRQPQVAAAHGQVAMAFGGPGAVYFAASADQGKSFGAPVKVADTPVLALGRHRGPRLAITDSALVITAVAGEKKDGGPHAHGLPADGNLLAWRSTDKGKTWSYVGPVNDEPGSAREGLHAMAAGPNGKIFAVWLDLRSKGTKLYGSQSNDGGKTWSKNVLVYESPSGTICQCCHPSAVIDAKGGIWVMWRNVIEGSRDLYVARSGDGVRFEAAAKQGVSTWKLDACPMDGGGLYVEGGKVTSAWRRESDIFVVEPGKPERRLAAGKDSAIAKGRGGAYVAWTRGTGGVEVLAPGGSEPKPLSPDGSFVSLTTLPDGTVLAAWETPRGIESRRLD